MRKLLGTQYSVILFVGVAGGLCVNLVLRNNKQAFLITSTYPNRVSCDGRDK